MKKGIVMEKRRKYAIVLTADGSFQKATLVKRHALIGDEVQYRPYKSKANRRKLFHAKMLSVAVLFVVAIFSVYFGSQTNTYAYVNVDFNASVEFKVDWDLNVSKISALNEEAESLVEHLNELEINQLEAIIFTIMSDCEESDLVKNGKEILIGINDPNPSENELTTNLKSYLQEVDTDWQVVTFHVPDEVRKQALENETSMNKEFATYIRTADDSVLEESQIDEEKVNKIHSYYNTN